MMRTYDPKAVTVVVAGQIITGFAEDTFIGLARNEDMYTLQVGADGEATRSRSNNKSGRLTLTLRQGSPGNEILSALANADELAAGGVFSMAVKDNSGTSLHSAVTAWIVKMADTEYAREAKDREWVIETDNLISFVGSNAPGVPTTL